MTHRAAPTSSLLRLTALAAPLVLVGCGIFDKEEDREVEVSHAEFVDSFNVPTFGDDGDDEPDDSSGGGAQLPWNDGPGEPEEPIDPPDDGDWPMVWADLEWAVLDLVNEERALGATCGGAEYPPVGPLEMNELVRDAARFHSEDMAINHYFSHDSLDGRDFMDRMNETGFNGDGPWGENIAMGYPDPASVMAGWMSSPGHCANIMNGSYRVIGIGYAEDPNSYTGAYWTQDFAGSH